MLKMCISKHCHEVTGFLLWIGTYCISCVAQQRSRVKDLFSLVGYDDSWLVEIRHVKSIISVVTTTPKYSLPQRLVQFMKLALRSPLIPEPRDPPTELLAMHCARFRSQIVAVT